MAQTLHDEPTREVPWIKYIISNHELIFWKSLNYTHMFRVFVVNESLQGGLHIT